LGFLLLYQIEQRDDFSEWKRAMQRKLDCFEKQKVFKLQKRESQKVSPSRWVLALKQTKDGALYKARFIICRSSQIHGLDYDETFAPTLSKDTL
jgi:hypothetical protein